MPLPPLREREKRILFFLRLWQWEKRYTPSAGEIGSYFGVHKATISAVLSSLKKKGYIDVNTSKNWRHRTILFPKGTDFPWGNEQLPDELFDYLRPEERAKREAKKEKLPDILNAPTPQETETNNGKDLQSTL